MGTSSDFGSILFILIFSIGMVGYIYGKRGLEFRNIILLGFLMRIVLLFADYYHWFPIINSGADTEMFHKVSAANVGQIVQTFRGGYTRFLTIVYTLTDTSRLIAQYINVLFGMGIIMLMSSCMDMLEVAEKNKKIAICVLALLPNLNIFSAILLREAWVEFFVALSLYYFVKWFISGNGLYIGLVVASVLSAAYMHAGVIGLILGYAIAFVTYNPRTGVVTFSRTTIISLVFMGIITVGVSSYLDLFTSKFARYESIDDIVAVTNSGANNKGDSAYLQWINSDSVVQSLLFAPLKMFYFLFSPLPTEWRRLNDIIGFLIDGMIYMGMCYAAFKYKADDIVNTNFKRYLVTALLVTTFIFGYGTSNAGTAFRHRNKIVSVVVLTFAVSTIRDKRELL